MKYNFKQRKSKRHSIPLPPEMVQSAQSLVWGCEVQTCVFSGGGPCARLRVPLLLLLLSWSQHSLTLANLCRPLGKGANSWRPMWPSLLRHTASPPLASSTPSEQGKVVAIGGGASITAERGQAAEAASPGTAPV